MMPDQIDALLKSGPDRSLDGLEVAVWRGVDAERAARRGFRAVASVQVMLAFLAVLASAIWGASWASQAMAQSTPTLGVFSPGLVLAPSSRLVGSGQ